MLCHIEANKTRKVALGYQTNQWNLKIGKSSGVRREGSNLAKKKGTWSFQRHEIAHKAVE